MSRFQPQVGRIYLTRVGRYVKIIDRQKCRYYPLIGIFVDLEGDIRPTKWAWCSNGQIYLHKKCNGDLIGEVI